MNVKQADEKHNKQSQNGILLNTRQDERGIYFHLSILFRLLATSDGPSPTPLSPPPARRSLQLVSVGSEDIGLALTANYNRRQAGLRSRESIIIHLHVPLSSWPPWLPTQTQTPRYLSRYITSVPQTLPQRLPYYLVLSTASRFKKKKKDRTVAFYLHFSPPISSFKHV